MKVITAPLSGFMELTPADQIEFDRLKGIILETYESYGYTPIDTPTIERSEVLEAKAGGETQKQIYRFTRGDTDLSLRFDLTVPLSRYVVEHRNDLVFPFRRSHIGKVFRGEKAQKGRFREFYQCDVDVIGVGSLSINYDSEIIALINATFTRLNLAKFLIRVNNRKLLQGFLEAMGVPDKKEIIAIIDKSEKIGMKAVKSELELLRLNALEIRKIVQLIGTYGNATTIKEAFDKFDLMHPLIDEGLAEI
ncbi:MAG: histidine--tRNA ligase family protein, partial [Pseudomonadales bacterium]|nr:histidine--tRNA ligase family protein [Pseudomonadales bacterium]